MPITDSVYSYLEAFLDGRAIEGGLAYRAELVQAKLDFSPRSLERIDQLLQKIRTQSALTEDECIQDSETRNFLNLLCVYAGYVVSRYTQRTCEWYGYDEFVTAKRGGDGGNLPDVFSTSLICTYENGDVFTPLGTIVSTLFEETPARNLTAAADQFMRRILHVPVLHPCGQGATLPTDKASLALHGAARKAGQDAALAVAASLIHGSDLIASLALEMANGHKLFVQLIRDDPLEEGLRRFEQNSDQSRRSTFLYDGFMNLPQFRTDALTLMVRDHDAQIDFQLALPYRHASNGAGFAFHSPRLMEMTMDDARVACIASGFFQGYAESAPALPWDTCFVDEDSPENLAARNIGLPISAPKPIAEMNGLELGHIDIARCVAELPASERSYLEIPVPAWVADDALVQFFQNIPLLLIKGRVVWAHIIQVNEALFEPGERQGHPGELVYDPHGGMTPQGLAAVAAALFALKGRSATLDTDDPAERALRDIAEYLENELIRVFGWAVPPQISTAGLQISTVYFARKHFPREVMTLPYFPVLICDDHPGAVMVLPSRWWPEELREHWQKPLLESARQKWLERWNTLAKGRTTEEEEYFQHRVEALQNYGKSEVSEEKQLEYHSWGMCSFSPRSDPSPLDWEWTLKSELDSYAENVLGEAERDRARGLRLNIKRAQNAFAARYTGQMIGLHRLLLCPARGCSPGNMLLEADEIQYVALGLVAGCEESALHMARLMCAAWRLKTPMYADFVRPEVRFIFQLLAGYLKEPIPELVAFKERPRLNDLRRDDCWMTADALALAPLLEAACVENTEEAPTGPFQGLPIALLLIFKLRHMQGLKNPEVKHLLLAAPLGPFPKATSLEAATDPIVANLRKQLGKQFYDEQAIADAIFTSASLERSLRGRQTKEALFVTAIYFVLTLVCVALLGSADALVWLWLLFMAALAFGVLTLLSVISIVRFLLRLK